MFWGCPECEDTGLVQLDLYRPFLYGVCECEVGQEMAEMLTCPEKKEEKTYVED